MSSYVIILFAFLFLMELVFKLFWYQNIHPSFVAEILPGFKMRQKNIISCKGFITTKGKKTASSNNVEGESQTLGAGRALRSQVA